MADSTSDRLARLLTGLAGLARVGAVLATAGRGAIAALWQNRARAYPVAPRALWWGALLSLLLGGRVILGTEALPGRLEVLAPFAIGLGCCALVRLLASADHLRTAALGLGAVHGLAAAMVWSAFA